MNLSELDRRKFPFPIEGTINYRKNYQDLQHYPEFMNYPDKEAGINFNIAFRYVMLIYTPNTPLLSIAEYPERRLAAAQLSLINQKHYKELFSSGNSYVNQIIIAYVRMMKNPKWTKMCVFMDAYYNQLSKLQSGNTEAGERTNNLLDNINKIEKNIEDLTNELLNSDHTLRLVDDLYQRIEQERLYTPEEIAQSIFDGKDPLNGWTPWADDRNK